MLLLILLVQACLLLVLSDHTSHAPQAFCLQKFPTGFRAASLFIFSFVINLSRYFMVSCFMWQSGEVLKRTYSHKKNVGSQLPSCRFYKNKYWSLLLSVYSKLRSISALAFDNMMLRGFVLFVVYFHGLGFCISLLFSYPIVTSAHQWPLLQPWEAL